MLLLLQPYPRAFVHQAVMRLWEFVVWMFSLGQSWWLWCWQRVTWHWSMDEFTQNTPDDRHTHTKYPKLFHSAIDIQVFRLYDARPSMFSVPFAPSFMLESTPRAFHIWPEKTGTPWVWPDQTRHCQGWNIARKHVVLVPCLIGVWVVTCCLCSTQLWWYRPWDLSLGGAFVVATPTCGCATMLVPCSWHRFVFVTFCWDGYQKKY